MNMTAKLCSYLVLCFLTQFLFDMTDAYADIEFPSIFGNYMVLQCNQKLNIWDWAEPGEKVNVEIDGISYTATTDVHGDWSVIIQPLTPGGPYTMICSGNNRIELHDILAGEVWLASGQSNMEMRLCHVDNADREVADALHFDIRLFQVTNDLSPIPLDNCEGRWEQCRPSTADRFSAAAYFFGRAIHDSLNVPVGLIHTSGAERLQKHGCVQKRQNIQRNIVRSLSNGKRH